MNPTVKSFCKSSLLSIILLSSTNASALIEARLSYGLNNAGTSLDSLSGTPVTTSAINPLYGLTGDILFNIPLANWGLGVRYENLGLTVSAGTVDFSAKLNRMSAVGYYRLIDTILFLGPIATYGFDHKMEMAVKENGLEISKFSSSQANSYSIGIEGGMRLIGMVIGMEIGTLSEKHKDVSDANGTLANRDIDLSGTYGKILVGFSM